VETPSAVYKWGHKHNKRRALLPRSTHASQPKAHRLDLGHQLTPQISHRSQRSRRPLPSHSPSSARERPSGRPSKPLPISSVTPMKPPQSSVSQTTTISQPKSLLANRQKSHRCLHYIPCHRPEKDCRANFPDSHRPYTSPRWPPKHTTLVVTNPPSSSISMTKNYQEDHKLLR